MQVNNSTSKEENINDKVNNTSGHHYTIDDIDTKTLIAPKNSNYEFKQVYVQNNKKNVVRTAVVQEVINVMSVATKNILVILNNIENQLTKEYSTLVINVIIKEHPSHISQVMSNQFTKEYTTHVINVITRQQELDISTVIN